MLLLIYCSKYFTLFVGVLCVSVFCHALLCVPSIVAIIFEGKRKLVVLFFIVLVMSCYCKCSVALPRDALGWPPVCD